MRPIDYSGHDHLAPDGESFDRIRHYIEWNPVKAGLAGTPPGRAAAQKADPTGGLPVIKAAAESVDYTV